MVLLCFYIIHMLLHRLLISINPLKLLAKDILK